MREEAAKYYANIVLPYGAQVVKALDAVSGLDIDMIAPSHGVIWRTFIPRILEETENRALIVYDSMWGSTEKIAFKLYEGLVEAGVPTTVRNLKAIHISDVMTDVLSSKLILIGSPTLNGGVLPTVGAFLTYIRGLKPRKRVGLAFGSYGWASQAVKEIDYIPDDEELTETQRIGKELGEILLKK